MVYGVIQMLHLVFGLFFALLTVCAIRGISLHLVLRVQIAPTGTDRYQPQPKRLNLRNHAITSTQHESPCNNVTNNVTNRRPLDSRCMNAASSIAIVGMACVYPDARSPGELWENVLAQRRAFRRVPPERSAARRLFFRRPAARPTPPTPTEAAVIEGYEFDRVAFRVVGSTFRAADLAHWLALDVASRRWPTPVSPTARDCRAKPRAFCSATRSPANFRARTRCDCAGPMCAACSTPRS